MKVFVTLLFLLLPIHLFADKISGLNINIYQKITGLWDDPEHETDLEECYNCKPEEFGWGKVNVNLFNYYTIIDPVDNGFQFSAMQRVTIKSFKEIEANIFEMELNFMQGRYVEKYRITVLKDGLIQIVDFGGTANHNLQNKYFKRVIGPNIKDGQYGSIKGTLVRIRGKPNLNAKIKGIIPNGDRIFYILETEKKYKINSEDWKWYKIVSDSGYTGWVYGKYIVFEK